MKIKAVLIILLLSTLACLNGNSEGQPSISPQDAVSTSVAATLIAESGGSQQGPPDTQAPPTQAPPTQAPPTQAPPPEEPQTQAPPACQPQHPGAQSLQLSSALAVGSTADASLINIVDFQGNSIGSKSLTGLSWQDPDQIHFAAGISAGIPSIPVPFHSLANGDTLKLEQNGTITQLAQISGFLVIAGENGGGNIAYSQYASVQSGWSSSLYATPYGNASGAQIRITRNEGDGYVLWPLAVHTVNGQAQGVWYTESMYGIGNIIFHPYRDLLYLNLSNNQVTSYLGSAAVVAGFSPDHTWVAFGQDPGSSPGQPQGSLTLKNLVTCQEVTLNFHATSNLGGGWVSFSPDNQMVSWLEASGLNPMEATLRLRVSRIDGTLIVDAPISNLTGLAGGEIPSWITPMGWSDNHLLILEVRISGSPDPLVIMWAPDQTQPLDPVLGANQSVLLSSGNFMGFLYP